MKTTKRSFKEISRILSIVLNLSIFVIVAGITIYFLVGEGLEFKGNIYKGVTNFRFFTILSNTFLGIICLISAIFEITHIKKVDYRLPYILHILKLSATTATLFAFVFCIFYLGPENGFLEVFSNEKLFYHFINPWISVLTFSVFEEKMKYKFKDYVITLLPMILYGALYYLLVKKGLWEDYYSILGGNNAFINIVLMLGAVTIIALLVILLQKLVDEVSKIHSYNYFNEDAIDAYNNKVFKAVFIIAPMAALFAAFIYGVCFVMGYFPKEKYWLVVIFCVTCLAYLFLALWLITNAFKKDGVLDKKALTRGKIYLCIFLPLQFNFISYVIPSTEFWGFSFFFIILASFFFDSLLITVLEIEMVVSIVISWLLVPGLMPVSDTSFIPNMILRITCLVLGYVSIQLITRFGGKMLVRELEKISDYDPLTLLRSRRKMDRTIKELLKRNKNNLCLAMLDIDDFKKVNDKYGHEKGDEILKIVSNIIITSVHETDYVFRFGGEEILIVFQTEKEHALRSLQRIEEKINDYKFYSNGEEFHISMSMGLKAKHDDISYDDLLEETDNNLYYAKEHGKKQICYK